MSQAWYRAFLRWADEPSPTGEWVYRGQFARYDSILPSLLRSSTKDFRHSQLFTLSEPVVQALLADSWVFEGAALHQDLLPSSLELDIATLFPRSLGTPFSLQGLSTDEILLALAQHYGFPTRLIDLTANPIVAAFFATHSLRDGRYTVPENEPGKIYRWPVVRSSSTRLHIPVHDDEAAQGASELSAIDLTNISRYTKRPHSQAAVMAFPVSSVLPFDPPYPFTLAPEDLRVIDMARLGCCDRFDLLAGAGHTFQEVDAVSGDALFPDRIDLGYSYLAVMALLSIILHKPGEFGLHNPGGVSLEDHFSTGIRAGRAILRRESMRLVPGYPTTRGDVQLLIDAEAVITSFSTAARRAVAGFGNPRLKRRVARSHRKLIAAAREEMRRRVQAWRDSTNAVDLGRPEPLEERFPIGLVEREESWIVPEINRRLEIVQAIIVHAEKVPAYAFQDPTRYQALIDSLPNDTRYESEVTRQIHAQRVWSKDETVFPPFRP